MNRELYETIFRDEDDVFSTAVALRLLGGISEVFLFREIKAGHLKTILCETPTKQHLVPKIWLIDYILSDRYQSIKHTLKAQI